MSDRQTEEDPEEAALSRAGRLHRRGRLVLAVAAGLVIVGFDALYMTFAVPADGLLDVRESFLGIGLLALGVLLMLWPLLKFVGSSVRTVANLVTDALARLLETAIRRKRTKTVVDNTGHGNRTRK